MAAAVLTAAGPIRLGRVIRSTIEALRGNILVYGAMAVIFAGVPGTLGAWFISMSAASDPIQQNGWATYGAPYLVAVFERLAAYPLLAGVMIGTMNQLRGQRITFRECLTTGLRSWGAIFGLSFVVGVRTWVGFFLLIVPGLIMAINWIVAGPVLLKERRGITRSMQRSRELVKGRRWPVAGLLLIYLLVYFAILSVFAALGAAVQTTGVSALVGLKHILQGMVNMAADLIAAAGLTCLYDELRSTKEGDELETVAAVFQ